MEIKGKTAVVTGGGSGIGRATVVRLAAEGAAVLAADLDEAGMRETVRLIEGAGGRVAAVRADVTNAEQARHMMDTALSLFGRFDILHNNAGIAIGTPPFPQCDLDRWRRVLDIDLQAVILGCFLAGPMMQRGGGGAIVNTGLDGRALSVRGRPGLCRRQGGRRQPDLFAGPMGAAVKSSSQLYLPGRSGHAAGQESGRNPARRRTSSKPAQANP